MPRLPRWVTLRFAVLALALLGATAVVGWHNHSHSHGTLRVTGADGITRELGEWRLGSSEGGELPSVKAGELQFELENADSVVHDFVLVRTDADGSELPVTNGRVDLANAGQVVGEIAAFAPGESAGSTFDLEAGNYVLFCNIEGHYNGGMYYSLTVEE